MSPTPKPQGNPISRGQLTLATAFVLLVSCATYDALRRDLWDDGLFFQRFARNLIHHGVAAWNLSDGPVHGNTSQLFQLVATGVEAAVPGYYHVGIKVLSGLALVATGLSAVMALRVWRPEEDPDDRTGQLYVILCGLSAPTILALISSGMETLLALWVLSAFLVVLAVARRQGFRSEATETGCLTAAYLSIYVVRPDMVLIAGGLLAGSLYDVNRAWYAQPRLARACAAALGANLLLLAGFAAYYGTAFPLSAYLKNRLLSSYTQSYQALGQMGERRQFLTWLLMTAPFAYLAAFRQDRSNGVLLGSAAVFVLYHHQTTVGIMGYHGRFFLPATVPVVLAAALAWPSVVRSSSRRWIVPLLVLYLTALYIAYEGGRIEAPNVGFYLGWIRGEPYVVYLASLVVLGSAAVFSQCRALLYGAAGPAVALSGSLYAYPVHELPRMDDEAATSRIAAQMRAMTGIHQVKACLPGVRNVYHSELGVPGVMFPNATVTDLSGLMNPALAFERPAFDTYCLPDPPEVLFLPHRTHEALNAEIAQSRCLTRFARPKGIPRSSSTLYIRKDHVDDFDRCTGR